MKLVFLNYLLLRTTLLAFDVNNDEEVNEIKDELVKTFGYPFKKIETKEEQMWNEESKRIRYDLHRFDDVSVWKILEGQQMFKPEDYSNGFTEFGSNETFLIFAKVPTVLQSCVPLQQQYIVYYWVGIDTTLEQKKNVAKYAAMFFTWMSHYLSIKNDIVNFTREDQIFESESFIRTLNYLREIPQRDDNRIKMYVNESFPLNGPNLYIVKKDQTRRVVKVPIGLGPQLITLNTCLVVETPPYVEELYPVTTFCGKDSDNCTYWKAVLLTRNLNFTADTSTLAHVISKGSGKFKALLELLENKNYYRPSESKYLEEADTIIRVQDDGVLFFDITITNVDGQQMMTRTIITERPIEFYKYNPDYNYILDTKSVAGIFFVYANNIDIDRLAWSIQDAEEYLHNETLSLARPIRMRISDIEIGEIYIDFMINEEHTEEFANVI